MSPEQRLEELEDCITANDKELQEIYAENTRLKEENAMLFRTLGQVVTAADRIVFEIGSLAGKKRPTQK